MENLSLAHSSSLSRPLLLFHYFAALGRIGLRLDKRLRGCLDLQIALPPIREALLQLQTVSAAQSVRISNAHSLPDPPTEGPSSI